MTGLDGYKILIIGSLGSGKTTIAKRLSKKLGYDRISIDDCRERYGDGSVTGEYRAWICFIEACNNDSPMILEFTGGGPHVFAVKQALLQSKLPIYIVWLDPPHDVCIKRASARQQSVPTPYPWGPVGESVIVIYEGIETAWNDIWAGNDNISAMRLKLNGEEPAQEIFERLLNILTLRHIEKG